MSVSTGTLTLIQHHIGNNQFMLKASIASAGDASGGGIAVTKDLANYIPNNSLVEVIDAIAYNTGASDKKGTIQLTSTEWTMGIGSILGYNVNDVKEMVVDGTPTIYYFQGKDSALVRLPLFLGRPTSATKNMTLSFAVNTNATDYSGVLRFRITISAS